MAPSVVKWVEEGVLGGLRLEECGSEEKFRIDRDTEFESEELAGKRMSFR